jgi:tetratricopeptide (TPR) repeat protein
MVEPLAIKYAEDLMKNRGLGDYAEAAPALEEHYKKDFLLLAAKSLVKAIESRMARNGGSTLVDQALREGFVLTPHFAEQLAIYEKQEQSMRFYFPELISSIDLKKEERRLENVQFASGPAVRKARPVAPAPKPELSGPQKTLEEAETHYAARRLDQARELYRQLLQQTEEKPLHAKAYYGLARIAALQKDPELAEKLFQKTLELEPDGQVKSWSYVYLGRLADLAGEREQAARHYRAALASDGASPAARQAAEQGLKETFPKKE